MAKLAAILGVGTLAGAIFQALLGFSLPRVPQALGVHAVVGYAGVVMVLALAVVAWRRPRASRVSKILMTIIALAVVGQAITGTVRLFDVTRLQTSHLFSALIIVGLVVVEGAITARGRRTGS